MEETLVQLSILVVKKLALEKKLKKTIRCLLRKCFTCMGMTTIEEQLKEINQKITLLKISENRPILIRSNSI